jgi:5'-3' exonuclease
MNCNLIIDGNYILNKNVFALHKNNILYGNLYKSLEHTIRQYRAWFPFTNVWLVSDSKMKSWRKKIYPDYKVGRKRDSDIDWEFAFNAYGDFKKDVKGIRVLEADHIEGDDWISYLINESNKSGISTITVSNDHDIKQLLDWQTDPLIMNIMANEMYNKEKIFMPKNYQIFLNNVGKLDNGDIFNLNENANFLQLLDKFATKCEIIEVDPLESFIVKLISGDKSDNIKTVWSQRNKKGEDRGIGKDGAKGLFDKYIDEFGEPSLADPDLFDNIADLIIEKKKLSKNEFDSIKERLNQNWRLINLNIDSLPKQIVTRIDDVYNGASN